MMIFENFVLIKNETHVKKKLKVFILLLNNTKKNCYRIIIFCLFFKFLYEAAQLRSSIYVHSSTASKICLKHTNQFFFIWHKLCEFEKKETIFTNFRFADFRT